jgi:tetratricopeptide (TPR) repeat protein
MVRWFVVAVVALAGARNARAECSEAAHAAGRCKQPALVQRSWQLPPATPALPAPRRPIPAPPTTTAPAATPTAPPSARSIAALRGKLVVTSGVARLALQLQLADALAQLHQAAPTAGTLAAALDAYDEAVRDPSFATFARADEVLFGYAQLLAQAQRMADARVFYTRLLRDYPSSRYVPETFLAFAEHYFAAGDLEHAKQFYEQVRKFPKATSYHYATYKLAWLELNLARHAEALAMLVQVTRDARDARLARAAALDLPRFYADAGRPDLAAAFFERSLSPGGTPDERRVRTAELVRKLAEIYFETGRYDHVRAVLRDATTRDPHPERACGDALLRLQAALHANSRDVPREADAVVTAAARGGVECAREADALIGTTAMLRHDDARASRRIATFDEALALYARATALATTPDRRIELARRRAIAGWQRAEREATSAAAWVVAGELLSAKDVPADVQVAAVDAYDNALRTGGRRDPALTARIRAGLAAIASARARELERRLR